MKSKTGNNQKTKSKYSLKEIFNLDDSPKVIAFSFSIGAFLAFSPFYGLQTLTALLIAVVFRLNKISAIAGTLVNNPWTMVPIYTADAVCGFFVLGKSLSDIPKFAIDDFTNLSQFLHKVVSIFYPLLIGSIIVGMIAAVSSFFIVNFLVTKKRKHQKLMDNTP